MPMVRVTVVLGAVGLAAFATLAALPAPAGDDAGAPIFGFSKQTAASQLDIERRIKGHASIAPFRYHATMTRLWGIMTTRLANADLPPLDYRPYAKRVYEQEERLAAAPDRAAAALGGGR